MGADGGMSGPVGRGDNVSSSDFPLLTQYLSLEPITLANQKYMRSGELRRALGFPLVSVSEDHMFKVSTSKPHTPVATEDLRLLKESVSNASIEARQRMKMLSSSIDNLDKLTEDMGSKKRQRTDLLAFEKPSVPTLSKTVCQHPRDSIDQSAQRMEDRAKCAGINKRFRLSTVDKIDIKPVSLTKDQMSNEKDANVTKPDIGASVQPQERILKVSSVGEGWQNKNTKKRRSIGTCMSRLTDNDSRRTLHTKQDVDTKLTCDNPALRLSGRPTVKQGTSTCSPGTVIKARSRRPRTGSVVAANTSDVQAPETSEGCKQATSTSKTISLGLMQNHHISANSSPMLGQWAGQRQQKSSRGRRSNVVSPVSNHDKVQLSSIIVPPVIGIRSTLNEGCGCLDTHSSISKSKIEAESMSPHGLLSEATESEGLRGSECVVEEKGKDASGFALNGKGKVRALVVPTKRNKVFRSENVVDGVRRQGRTVRGFSFPRPGASQSELKSENISTIKRTQNTRPGSEKIRSKSGKPPAKRMSDGRVEFDDDHEELLAAAASARKASYLCCSGRFWKKMEPVFSSVNLQDVGYLKQQLIFGEELEASQSLISGAENKFLEVLVHKERADASFSKKGSKFNQVFVEDEAPPVGKRLDKFSSLYQRVLSALIEEDENEGLYSGHEGGSMSFQCASDDSHCGSCNYADAEIRDKDRFDSEAESILDFPIQKRYPGDRFSCTKSVTSNTTWSTSMSDSLHSSGRWLGDDGLSYSDAEFISGSCQNELGGPQPLDVAGTFYDCQYQLMCVDDRLVLELQSIGLYPDSMLDEGEVIDRDITGLTEGLYEQIGKKKDNLVKIDRAIQNDRKMEKVHMEQVAMEQLIQMAYKRRMASRRNGASKTIMRRVSKQVAMGFIKRTLARCKTFEVTGQSCFSEPALQDVIFAVPQSNDLVVNTAPVGFGATKYLNTSRADAFSTGMPGSCIDDLGRASGDSPQTVGHSSEHGLAELESVSQQGRKRESLLDDIGAASLRGRAKGKNNERNRESSRGSLTTDSMCENQSVRSFLNEEKPKSKFKKNTASAIEPLLSSIQSTGNNKRSREIWLSSSGNDPIDACDVEVPIDIYSMMPLDNCNDPSAPDDLNAWLNMEELLDDNCDGLAIPMDDLSMVI